MSDFGMEILNKKIDRLATDLPQAEALIEELAGALEQFRDVCDHANPMELIQQLGQTLAVARPALASYEAWKGAQTSVSGGEKDG